jgi:hypothetical protein
MLHTIGLAHAGPATNGVPKVLLALKGIALDGAVLMAWVAVVAAVIAVSGDPLPG